MLTLDKTITLFLQGFKLLFLRRAGGTGWSFCPASCCPLLQGALPRTFEGLWPLVSCVSNRGGFGGTLDQGTNPSLGLCALPSHL